MEEPCTVNTISDRSEQTRSSSASLLAGGANVLASSPHERYLAVTVKEERYVSARRRSRRWCHTCIYSNKTWNDIIFRDELARLASQHPDRLTIVHSLTREEDPGAYGPAVRKAAWVSRCCARRFRGRRIATSRCAALASRSGTWPRRKRSAARRRCAFSRRCSPT
jgi:hypothetical protein